MRPRFFQRRHFLLKEKKNKNTSPPFPPPVLMTKGHPLLPSFHASCTIQTVGVYPPSEMRCC